MECKRGCFSLVGRRTSFHEWSNSHFEMYSKCDIFLNNVCEVFNKTLIGKNDFEHTYIHLDDIHEANSDEARKNESLWRSNLP